MKYLRLALLFILCTLVISADDFKKYSGFNKHKDFVNASTSADVTPPLPAGTFVIAYVDTTQVNVQASGFAELDSFMINYALSAYPTTRTAGTSLVAGNDSTAINDDNIAVNLTDKATYYFRMWLGDASDNWTTADSANSDTMTTPDLTAPIQIVSVTMDTNGVDSIDVTVVYGGAEYDSVRIQWNDSTITSRTYGTNALAGHDTTNVTTFAHGLVGADSLYARVYLSDSLDNWNTGKEDTLYWSDVWPMASGTLVATGVVYDSISIVYTAGTDEDGARSTVRSQTLSYSDPGDTTDGTEVLAWRDYGDIDTTVYLNANQGQQLTRFITIYHKDSLENMSVATDTAYLTTTPYPTLTSYVADTLAQDSVKFDIAGYTTTGSTLARVWIGMSYTSIAPDTNAWGDSTYVGADSVSSQHWAHGLSDTDSLFFYVAIKNADNTMSYPGGGQFFYKDTLVVPDLWALPTIATISADTNGTDSIDVTITGYTNTVGEISRTWLGFTDTPIASPDTSGYGDSTYAYNDSISTHTFAHVLADQDTFYFYVLTMNSFGTVSVAIIDTLNVPDMWAPTAGTLAAQTIIPIGRDSLSITSFGGTADLALIYLDLYSGGNWVNVYTNDDSSVTDTVINFAVHSISWDAKNDSLFARLRLADEALNYTSVYDTAVADSNREVKLLADTSVAVIQSIRLYMSADSNGTITDSSYFLIADCDTTFDNDTLVVFPPAPTDTFWYAARPMIEGTWGSIGGWKQYPEYTGDDSPPPAAAVFTATSSDSTGITIVATGFAEWDTCIIRYATSAYPISISDGTSLTATNDSTTINDDLFALDLVENTVYYVRMFLGDSVPNWIAAADANSDTCTTVNHETTPPDTAGTFTATSSDSSGVTIVWTGFPEVDSLRIQYSDTGYVSGRTVGTNLIATSDTTAVNDDLIAADLTCNTTYFISGFIGDTLDNWTPVANLDTCLTAACAAEGSYCSSVTWKLFGDSSDFWLDFDKTDSTSTACLGDGTSETGTLTGATIAANDTVSPGSGGNALFVDATADRIIFDNKQPYFRSLYGQMTFKFWIQVNNAAAIYLIYVEQTPAQERLLIALSLNGQIELNWEDNNAGLVTATSVFDMDTGPYYAKWVQVHMKWDTELGTEELGVRCRVDNNSDGDFSDGGAEDWSAWTYNASGACAPWAVEPTTDDFRFGLPSGTYESDIYIDDVEFSYDKP